MAARRRLRLMLTGFFAALGIAMLVNCAVDPWGAWRFQLIPSRYRRVNEERVATPYLLRTAAPQTLLLGSSRVRFGMRIEQEVKDGVENAALSGSRLREIALEVKVALRNPRLKRIIWGVEFYTFDSYGDICSGDTCARLDGDLALKLTDNVFSYDTFVASYRMALRAMTNKITREASQPIPWPNSYICEKFAHPNPPTLAGMDEVHRFREVSNLPEYLRFNYAASQRQAFVDIVDRIRDAHVELIAFVPPLTQFELEMIRQTGRWRDFQDWKRFLAQHINYTDFSGYNEISHTDRMFIDAWHVDTAGGATILRKLLGDSVPQCPDAAIVLDSALPVTADNVDQMLALQERRKREATAAPNPYSTMVAAAILQRYGRVLQPELSASR